MQFARRCTVVCIGVLTLFNELRKRALGICKMLFARLQIGSMPKGGNIL